MWSIHYIVNVMDNLYLLPSSDDFTEYPDFLEMTFMPNEENYKEKRISYFAKQLDKVKENYDFVIVDVPPTLSVFTDSAVYAADDIIIVLQTQQDSLLYLVLQIWKVCLMMLQTLTSHLMTGMYQK